MNKCTIRYSWIQYALSLCDGHVIGFLTCSETHALVRIKTVSSRNPIPWPSNYESPVVHTRTCFFYTYCTMVQTVEMKNANWMWCAAIVSNSTWIKKEKEKNEVAQDIQHIIWTYSTHSIQNPDTITSGVNFGRKKKHWTIDWLNKTLILSSKKYICKYDAITQKGWSTKKKTLADLRETYLKRVIFFISSTKYDQ